MTPAHRSVQRGRPVRPFAVFHIGRSTAQGGPGQATEPVTHASLPEGNLGEEQWGVREREVSFFAARSVLYEREHSSVALKTVDKRPKCVLVAHRRRLGPAANTDTPPNRDEEA